MPFQSENQRRFMWAKHPRMAKEWQSKTPEGAKLPEHVKKSSAQVAYLGYLKVAVDAAAEEREEAGTPEVPPQEVIAFLKSHPNPEDSDLHAWAEQKGYNVHKVEEVVYRLLTQKLSADKNDLIPGGKAAGKPASDFSASELAMGRKVEKEHTPNKAMQTEIAKDHLEEISDYYPRLKKMEEEAKVQQEKTSALYAYLTNGRSKEK